MTSRRNQILAGILVLQLVVLAIVFWPRGRAEGWGQPLFPDVQAGDITELVISQGEGEATLLSRGEAGWVLAEADDYPVLTPTVTTVLSDIVGLVGDRPVTTTGASHKRLKVADNDFEFHVEFELSDGSRHELFVGTSPTYGVAHVRADNESAVFLTSLQTSDLGTGPGSWVDRTFLKIDPAQVTAIRLENGQGTLEFQKDGEQWTMTGLVGQEALDATKVQTLLNRLNPLTMLRPLGKSERPEYGLAQPSAVLSVTAEGKSYRLRVGAKSSEDNSYIVASSESPYIVRVGQYSVADLVDKGRDSFLVQPTPTPAPTPEATAVP